MQVLELISLKMVETAIEREYSNFRRIRKQINHDELIKFIARQDEGRGKRYKYPIEELLLDYNLQKESDECSKELKKRIFSAPVYKVAVERFVFNSLIKYFFDSDIKYDLFISPNSSDISITIGIDQIKKVCKELINAEGESLNSIGYDGIVLHVDSKSIMALSNGNDALASQYLGKFEASWNQISYAPPRLRKAIENDPSPSKKIKHAVLPTEVDIDGKNFVTVTIFVGGLFYLEGSLNIRDIEVEDVTGEVFNSFFYIINLPNGMQQSEYYDMFFDAGKNGMDHGYPKDCRFKIYSKQQNQFLSFYGGDINDSIHRFSAVPRDVDSFTMIIENGISLTTKKVKIKR